MQPALITAHIIRPHASNAGRCSECELAKADSRREQRKAQRKRRRG